MPDLSLKQRDRRRLSQSVCRIIMKGHVVFSLDPRYGKTSLFFTHAGGNKAMASVFETFADFSAIGNVWKGLLLWGIQVTFPVPDRFPDLIFFPYSERFLRLADTKSRGKACGRPHQQLNPDMITRHITVCSKYFFFRACSSWSYWTFSVVHKLKEELLVAV